MSEKRKPAIAPPAISQVELILYCKRRDREIVAITDDHFIMHDADMSGRSAERGEPKF
jgi:hypothetical protein